MKNWILFSLTSPKFRHTYEAHPGFFVVLGDLTGSWALDLKGTQIRHFDLQIYQEDDLVLGTGQLSADQSGLAVNATGSVAGDRPTIFISLIDTRARYSGSSSLYQEPLLQENMIPFPRRDRASRER